MNLLHRYLLRELLFATFVAVTLFAFVLLAGTAIKDVITRAADGTLPLGEAAGLLLGLVPFVLTYALPLGLLTAILITLGRVSALHEVTAMRAAGLGLARIAAPVVFVAVLGVAVSLVVNYSYAPAAKSGYREKLHNLAQKNPMALVVAGTFLRDFRDVVIFIGSRDENVLRDVWVWKNKDHRPEFFAWAQEGRLLPGGDADHVRVEMIEASIFARNPRDPENLSGYKVFPGGRIFSVDLALNEIVRQSAFEKKISWMTLTELLAERQRLASAATPADQARLLEVRMTLHEQAALGFSVLSFALIGVPLAIKTGRKETSANLGIALGLTMVWYTCMLAVQWVEKNPRVHPELLQWLPNLGFQALGGWMWWRFGRN